MFRTLSLLACLAAIGCGAATEGSERGDELGSTSAAILNGEADQKAGVVGVFDRALGNACSGVLVNDHTVLTARHCIAPLGPDPAVVDCAKTTFGVASDAARVFVKTSAGEQAVVQVIVPEADGYCGNDLAVLILAGPVADAPIALRIDRKVQTGDKFSAVGVGDGTRLRRDGLQVQCVGAGCSSAQLAGHEWWGEGAVCEGDSGGPALDADGRVVGIASRKRAGCTATIYEDVAGSAFVASALGIEMPATTETEPAAQPKPAGCSASPNANTSFAPLLLGIAACVILRRRVTPQR